MRAGPLTVVYVVSVHGCVHLCSAGRDAFTVLMAFECGMSDPWPLQESGRLSLVV